jgi:hypothetical protein
MVQGLEMNTTVLPENLKTTVHCGDQGMDGRTVTTYTIVRKSGLKIRT